MERNPLLVCVVIVACGMFGMAPQDIDAEPTPLSQAAPTDTASRARDLLLDRITELEGQVASLQAAEELAADEVVIGDEDEVEPEVVERQVVYRRQWQRTGFLRGRWVSVAYDAATGLSCN